MAIERIGPFDRDAGKAGADLSDKLFYAVKRDTTTGDIVLATTGDIPLGFVLETAKQGFGVTFSKKSAGVVPAIAGGAIAIGDELIVAADGRLNKAAAAGDGFGAYARKAAIANDVLEVEFK